MSKSTFQIDIVFETGAIPMRRCLICQKFMRFVGTEPHSCHSRWTTFTYECACGEVEVQDLIMH